MILLIVFLFSLLSTIFGYQSQGKNTETITNYLAIQIPIQRKEKGEIKSPIMYNFLPADTMTLSLVDFQNLQYYFTLELGTPAMEATFTIDTGSHLTWLPPVPKEATQKYNYDKSSTAISSQNFESIQYGIGEVSGMMGSDIVQIPSLDITGVRLDILWALEEKDMSGQKSNGLTGFSNFKAYNNFLDLAYQNGQIKTSIFALQLGYSSETSTFFAGDYATDISNITFLPCHHKDYWSIKIETMYVNDKKFTSQKYAVVDSGTSALVLPTDMANYFLSQFPTDICKTYSSSTYGSFWACECYQSTDNFPVFKFYSQKIKFEITSADYLFEVDSYLNLYLLFQQNMEVNGKVQCIAQPLIMKADSLGFMIFGDVFMRKYLVTFDKVNNQVGFSGYLNNKVLYAFSIITLLSFGIFLAYGCYFFCHKVQQSQIHQPFLS